MNIKAQALLVLTLLVSVIVAQTTVSGKITRLYLQGTRVYFHLAGDGYSGQFGNYLYIDSSNMNSTLFLFTYELLLKHAGSNTVVYARKYTPFTSGNYLVAFIYVDY